MNQPTRQRISILVAEGDCEDQLTWPRFIEWVNKSAETARLILVATERATGDVFHGELTEVYDKGVKLILQCPEQFKRIGSGWKSVGYVEYSIRPSCHVLLPMRLRDGSVEIKMEGNADFDLTVYPHGAIECPQPSQR